MAIRPTCLVRYSERFADCGCRSTSWGREVKVNVAIDVLRGYRRRALARYPREYMETLWGRMRDGEVDIYACYPIDHKGTRDNCQYVGSDIEAQRDEDAPEHGLTLLGTIHSHPDGSSGPSEADFVTAAGDGDIVSGICQILRHNGRRRSWVRFYSGTIHELKVGRERKAR